MRVKLEKRGVLGAGQVKKGGSLTDVCAGTWVGLIFGFQRHLPSDPVPVA